jgi:hypothetical protein
MMPGIFAGKLIRSEKLNQEPVQLGPIPKLKVPDPVALITQAAIGRVPFKPNGAAQLDPAKIEFLGS